MQLPLTLAGIDLAERRERESADALAEIGRARGEVSRAIKNHGIRMQSSLINSEASMTLGGRPGPTTFCIDSSLSASPSVPFIDDYIAGRTDLARSTADQYRYCRKLLTEYFGERRKLSEITSADAEELAAVVVGPSCETRDG